MDEGRWYEGKLTLVFFYKRGEWAFSISMASGWWEMLSVLDDPILLIKFVSIETKTPGISVAEHSKFINYLTVLMN